MKEALKLKEIARQASRQNGCHIYDIYKHRDRLQVFIDKRDKKGVNLKDCENVFYSLQFLLRSELPHILENHRLEVSSPGLGKRLREKWHFEESIGKTMLLTANSPAQAKNTKTGLSFQPRSFTANLMSISKDGLNFKKDFIEYSIPLSDIKTAKLVFQVEEKSKQTSIHKKYKPKNNKRALKKILSSSNKKQKSEVENVS